MVDNVAITAGSGTDIATDDVGGVQYQRVKLSLGADGSATDALGGAGAVADGVQRVTLASDDPGVTSLAAIETALADPATQTTLAAVLAKLIAAPATEAKQDTGNTSLASIVTLLTTQAGYVDGLETLITSTNSKLDTVNTNLTTLDGRVDGLEALIGTTNSTLAAAIPAGTNNIGHVGGVEYETVAASQTAQTLGATGATGDYISGILVVPATTSPGNVILLDNATSITVFTGGTSSVSNLVPFLIPLGMKSVSGAWKITTGASVSVIGIGDFT